MSQGTGDWMGLSWMLLTLVSHKDSIKDGRELWSHLEEGGWGVSISKPPHVVAVGENHLLSRAVGPSPPSVPST